jgi:hypothetical protein
MRVFVARQSRSLWLAVCEYRGDGIRAHLSWVLPDNTTGQISFRSGYEGVRVLTNLTYEFPLALHEGQDLTCLFQNHHGLKERRTVHVPRYCKCNREYIQTEMIPFFLYKAHNTTKDVLYNTYILYTVRKKAS